MEPIDHLFRRESGRMVSVLTRIFGVHNLALAEDVVQDAFCRAVEVWKFRGAPENPAAWLMATAKNRAIDMLRRERTALACAPELGRLIEREGDIAPALEELFERRPIQDDSLRLMFSCCHPKLPGTAQVALVLHLLCGFSVGEIASAFFCKCAAMEKRLTRTKKTLAGSHQLFDLTDSDFRTRLDAVHQALYLLFNEGYHGAHTQSAVRGELCAEALRLAGLLHESPLTALPSTYALSALMRLHAARLPGRIDHAGELSSLFDQDRSRWDPVLISEGLRLLDLAATGVQISVYHIEAAIASLHATAPSADETDWPHIASLYGVLMTIAPSPVVALNRAIAIAQYAGPERGLDEIHAIASADRLAAYPFYHAALGELEARCGRGEIAREHYEKATKFARNAMERRFIAQRGAALTPRPPLPILGEGESEGIF
ncbi:RNA polymerase subunit sigma-24 [Capsulimonas corticalis]|uniref:RNA polymerase subunit sigma-24 n=1 Tax=Capsulimonas corticalis TaxID=2219043 RepID=A0A402CQD1_9BACT|nr:sigma-70 family RNA polymerase sigma factor [Capsulimonas corticalis]BDI32754.1 RNA polymerase subunit sigma-24 [Capsulimonas corticalis]